MRTSVSFTAIVALLLCGSAIAAQTKPMDKPEPAWAEGTIAAWDDAAKSFTVKDKDGKEWAFSWGEEAKVMGKAAVGEMVKVKYKKDKEGKAWATHIFVGKAEIEKAGKKEKPE